MTELIKALGPVKRRLRLGRLLSGAAAGFAAGAAAALALLTVTVFVPLEGRLLYAAALAAGGTLAGALGNALRPVKNEEAARAADGCGLRERTITALELADAPDSEMLKAQREDAAACLKALDPRQIRFRPPRKLLAAGAAALALCVIPALLQGPGEKQVSLRRELRDRVAQMEKQIDDAEAKEEKSGISEKEKAELRRLTEDLKRELSESRDTVDAMVALDKAETRLEEIRPKTAGDAEKAMQELAEALAGAGMDAAAQALEAADAAALAAQAGGLDADAVRSAAENLSAEAREMAEQLASAAQQGQMSASEAQQMMSGSQEGRQPGSPMQQALSGMKAMLGGQGQNASPSGAGSGGQAGGSGKQPGGGAGSGTTNEEQKGSGSSPSSGGKGSREPEFKEAEYETIYDPEKGEAASRDVATEQHSLGKDSVQIETGPGKGSLQGDVPYRQVVGEYAREEVQAAESARLTREQKEWVDEYYRRITEE